MKKVIVVLTALVCLAGMTKAQSNLGISLQGGVSMSKGDSYKTGFGGLGTFTYSAGSNLDIVASAGYLTYENKNYDNASLSTFLIAGGVRYYFTEYKFKPYLMAEAGFFSNKTEIEATLPGITLHGGTTTSLGFAGGIGFLYKLSNKLDFDVNAAAYTASDNFVTVLAGIHYSF